MSSHRRWQTLLGLMLVILGNGCAAPTPTATPAPPKFWFKHVFVIILENNAEQAVEADPYFAALTDQGTELQQYYGLAHPSQPNYLAVTAGETLVTDDKSHDLPQRNLADLLEAGAFSWKLYAEGYPGQCFTGAQAGDSQTGLYVRKHNPFVSYDDVRADPQRCARIVNAATLDADLAAGQLPDVSFYIPNENDDAHNTSIVYSGQWLKQFLGPKLKLPAFSDQTLVVVTFDEARNDGTDPASQTLFTVLLGPVVTAGAADSTHYNHYSLLRTIEDNFGLGTLGRHDAQAAPFAVCNFSGGCGQ